MKNIIYFTAILALAMVFDSVDAQTINWAGMNEINKPIISANLGWDYGVTYGLGFGYQFRIWRFPTIANIEYSIPSGDKRIDDFKTKLGIQAKLTEFNNFHVSAKIHGIIRRYESEMVRLVNFGSDMSVVAGYYRKIWFVAAEGGFDKSIVTHFRHSQRAKDRYPNVAGGWYQPSNGGNFYFGLQTGLSFWKNDIYVKAGKVINQNLETAPMIPFYAQVGYNFRFR